MDIMYSKFVRFFVASANSWTAIRNDPKHFVSFRHCCFDLSNRSTQKQLRRNGSYALKVTYRRNETPQTIGVVCVLSRSAVQHKQTCNLNKHFVLPSTTSIVRICAHVLVFIQEPLYHSSPLSCSVSSTFDPLCIKFLITYIHKTLIYQK